MPQPPTRSAEAEHAAKDACTAADLADTAARAAEEWPAHFVAFDLLRLSGAATSGWPDRRALFCCCE
ncbi:hypothetical protein ACFW9X_31495, partial [Streptomyces sp. NPDC059466]